MPGCREIDQPLDHVDRLRTAGAAVDDHGRRGGQHGMTAEMHRGDPVDALHLRESLAQWPEIDRVRAEVHDVFAAQAQEVSVGVERQLGDGGEVAALVVGQEAFRAARGPLDRTADALRRPGHQCELRREGVARAEVAAHVAEHGAAALYRHSERDGQPLAGLHHAPSRCGMDSVAPARFVVFAHDRARLHRCAGDALDPAVKPDDMGSLREGAVCCVPVADLAGEGQVAGAVGIQARRVRPHRVADRDHRRQRCPIDLHRFGAVGGDRLGLGHHHGDGLADIAHGFRRQRRIRRPIDLETRRQAQLGIGAARPFRVVRHRPQPVGHRVAAGEDGQHARQGGGTGNVDRANACMGVRRTHQRGVTQAGRESVGGVAPPTCQQAQVLDPGQRGANAAGCIRHEISAVVVA